MSTSINSNISGKFIVEDIHGNVLSEEHNEISDWGMVRLTNYDKRSSRLYMRALADNLKRIFPGRGSIGTVTSTSGGATPSAYVKNHRLQDRILPANYEHFNEPSVTKTTYTRKTDNTLVITFTKGSRLEFKHTTGTIQINELGIGFNYDENVNHTYNNKCLTNPQPLNLTNNNDSTTAVPPNIDHKDDVDFSLWSRSVVSPPIDVENGDILIVKYVLTIETDCDTTKENWNFVADTNTGAVPMPPRKTSVRRKPFYSLESGAASTRGAGGAITSWGWSKTEEGGIFGQDTNYNVNNNPNGFLGILPTLEQPFLGRNEIFVYDVINTNLYNNFPTHNTSVDTSFPSPTAMNAGLSATFVTALNNINFITAKQRHAYRTLQSGNTYVCQHRFLFNPGEWPTITNSFGRDAKNFSFLRFNADYKTFTTSQEQNIYTTTALGTRTSPLTLQPPDAQRINSGVFTALSGTRGYDPYQNEEAMYVGFDYTFTFTKQ